MKYIKDYDLQHMSHFIGGKNSTSLPCTLCHRRIDTFLKRLKDYFCVTNMLKQHNMQFQHVCDTKIVFLKKCQFSCDRVYLDSTQRIAQGELANKKESHFAIDTFQMPSVCAKQKRCLEVTFFRMHVCKFSEIQFYFEKFNYATYHMTMYGAQVERKWDVSVI